MEESFWRVIGAGVRARVCVGSTHVSSFATVDSGAESGSEGDRESGGATETTPQESTVVAPQTTTATSAQENTEPSPTGQDKTCSPDEMECECFEGTVRPCSDGGFEGNCADGEQTCRDGTWSDCSIQPASNDDCDSPGDDADCDGTPNSGCTCTAEETQPCGPKQAVGICKPGTSVCVDGSFQQCEGAVDAAIRDCSSSEDNDCDGSPDNTVDAACQCAPGTTQPCNEHPDFDGVGLCKAGSQTCEASANGATSYWGDCTGSVGPAPHDSCSVLGDDSNCNGMPNDSCDCQIDANCDDGIACTADSCANLTCAHNLEPGFCLIDGECVGHNTPDPSNGCRYCDATINGTGWTNASSGATCDDGQWCNGSDTCSAGTCQHEFNGNGRCTESGECSLNACDEERNSCYQPAGKPCGTASTIRRCADNECGGTVETVELTRSCSGSAATCPTQANEQVIATTSCDDTQACRGSDAQCALTLGCGDTYCDDSSGLCWTTQDAPFAYSQYNAIVHCDDLVLAGSADWHLPTPSEARSIMRGCDGDSCPKAEGPGVGGCYWPTEMGRCDPEASTSGKDGYWVDGNGTLWYPNRAYLTLFPPDNAAHVRCAISPN